MLYRNISLVSIFGLHGSLYVIPFAHAQAAPRPAVKPSIHLVMSDAGRKEKAQGERDKYCRIR